MKVKKALESGGDMAYTKAASVATTQRKLMSGFYQSAVMAMGDTGTADHEDQVFDYAASVLVRNLDPQVDAAWTREMRARLGAPSTTVALPHPVDGKKLASTRFISGSFSNHRRDNNNLDRDICDADKAPRFPLRPYADAFAINLPPARRPPVTPTGIFDYTGSMRERVINCSLKKWRLLRDCWNLTMTEQLSRSQEF